MKHKIAFYGNSSRLASLILEKWCTKNHLKYDIYLLFNSIKEINNLNFNNDIKIKIVNKNEIENFANTEGIKNLFILNPSVFLYFSSLKDSFFKKGITLYLEDLSFLKSHFDKYTSNQILKKMKIPIPEFCLLSEFCSLGNKYNNFPIIIKPRKGFASKDIFIIRDNNKLKEILLEIEDKNAYIVQNYIEQEYGEFSCTFIKNSKRKLKFLSIKRIKLEEYTIESDYKHHYNNHFSNRLINKIKKLEFNFAINIQYKLTNKGPIIFELNPRLGTAEIHRFEYNFDAFDILLSKDDELINYIEGKYILKKKK